MEFEFRDRLAIVFCVCLIAATGLPCVHPIVAQEVAREQPQETDSLLEVSPLQSGKVESGKVEANDSVLAPWEEDPIDNTLPRLGTASPRDFLVDVDDGEIEHLFDYSPVEPNNSTLIDILYRLQRFSLQDQQRFVAQTIDTKLNQLADHPEEQRLNLFAISGRVTSVARIDLVQRVAELYQLVDKAGEPRDFSHYYQIQVTLQPNDLHGVICCTEVPQSWLESKTSQLDEPFSASAMFLKINSRKDDPTELLLAAKHLEWFPVANTIDAELNQGSIKLAQFGFDVGLLADARKRDRKSINSVDTDCFYRLLSAVNSIDMDSQDDSLGNPPAMDLIAVLKHPESLHGELYTVKADIRRVTRVEVDHAFYREHHGLSQYYQLDGFVDTDVIIRDPQMEKRGLPEYGKRYPVSICVPRLPAGMQENSSATWNVTMPAFFFKNWTFRSQLSRETDPGLKHVGPLLIGLPPQVRSKSTNSETFTIITLTVMSALMFGFIWFGFWRLTKQRRLTDQSRFQLGSPKVGPPDAENDVDQVKPFEETADVDFPGIDP